MLNDDFLESRLASRRNEGGFRSLKNPESGIDFSSNDYLGIAKRGLLHKQESHAAHGSTGSRLLTGNSVIAVSLEAEIAAFHAAEAALIFNSGYDANIGLLSCVAQKGDTIIYDFLSHASIRDGIRLSRAQAFAFRHNDLEDLESRLKNATTVNAATMNANTMNVTGTNATGTNANGTVFVVTESVFSMDGDIAPLEAIVALCERFNAKLIVDEAHATGVTGPAGAGVSQELGIDQLCFARIYTFGKALGCHGAAVVGSQRLRDFLINFSRAFIYTTALPPSALHAIHNSYQLFPDMDEERSELSALINIFRSAAISFQKLNSNTPIQGVVIPGNEQVKNVSAELSNIGIDARPILYPTVPRGAERLRIVLHSYNTESEIRLLVEGLNEQAKKWPA